MPEILRNHIYHGDSLEVLKTLPDESVQCCVTSPPYWGLRDYGVEGQMGLESAPELFLEKMVRLFSQVRRVLKRDGVLWLNMGDCYAGSGNGSNDYRDECSSISKNDSKYKGQKPGISCGLKPKNLVGMPWRLALALQSDGWYLRSDIIWHKPSPMPESVRDRPTCSHEYIFLLAKNQKYYYNAEAIKEPVSGTAKGRGNGVNPKARTSNGYKKQDAVGKQTYTGFNARWKNKQNESFSAAVSGLVEKRNKRSVWTIPPATYPEAHFATFPPALVEPCVKAGSRPDDIVLDPFGGSGTTAEVAKGLGRDYVLIELNEEYIELAKRRLSREVKTVCEKSGTVSIQSDLLEGAG